MRIKFEYDAAKSAANRDKHGIDFDAAQALWDDPNAWVRDTLYTTEERFLITARRGLKFWTGVFTLRGNAVRIISVRRARKGEIDDYDRNKISTDEGP